MNEAARPHERHQERVGVCEFVDAQSRSFEFCTQLSGGVAAEMMADLVLMTPEKLKCRRENDQRPARCQHLGQAPNSHQVVLDVLDQVEG